MKGKPIVNSPLIKPYFLGGGGIELEGVPLGSHDDGYFEGPTPAKKQVQTLPLEGQISLGWETTGVWFGGKKGVALFSQ